MGGLRKRCNAESEVARDTRGQWGSVEANSRDLEGEGTGRVQREGRRPSPTPAAEGTGPEPLIPATPLYEVCRRTSQAHREASSLLLSPDGPSSQP